MGFILTLVVILSPSLADACVGCRTTGNMVEQGEPTTKAATVAFSWGVMFMLGMVTALGGGMGVYMKRTISRIDRQRDDSEL